MPSSHRVATARSETSHASPLICGDLRGADGGRNPKDDVLIVPVSPRLAVADILSLAPRRRPSKGLDPHPQHHRRPVIFLLTWSTTRRYPPFSPRPSKNAARSRVDLARPMIPTTTRRARLRLRISLLVQGIRWQGRQSEILPTPNSWSSPTRAGLDFRSWAVAVASTSWHIGWTCSSRSTTTGVPSIPTFNRAWPTRSKCHCRS